MARAEVTAGGPAPFAHRVAAWTLDAMPVAAAAIAATWERLATAEAKLAPARDAVVESMLRLFDGGRPPESPFSVFEAASAGANGFVAQANGLAHAVLEAIAPTLLVFSIAMSVLHVAGECSAWRGSPGKRLLGLHVAHWRGVDARVPFARSVARNLAGALSWLTLNLGHAWALLPPDHRTLHDRLAGTQVLGPDRPLPTWATLWLCLFALATLALPAWLFQWLHDAMLAAAFPG